MAKATVGTNGGANYGDFNAETREQKVVIIGAKGMDSEPDFDNA